MIKQKPWYHQWFGADYLLLYQHRSTAEADRTVDWLLGELKLPPDARILDLACGSGRHDQALARHGYTVYGLDLSWQLLTENWISGEPRIVRRLRGDMRLLPVRSGSLQAIFSLFTSFGYFADKSDDQGVLTEVARCLQPGGRYVLDFLNADLVKSSLVPLERRSHRGQKIEIKRWVDYQTRRVEKQVEIQDQSGSVRQYRESVYLYTREELQDMLEAAGLKPQSISGNYNGSEYHSNSPRLIIISGKDA